MEDKEVRRRMYDPSVLPDMDDANLYCRSCKVVSKSLDGYQRHLRDIHDMVKPKQARFVSDMKAVDTSDPENRCCDTCKLEFSNKPSYKRHMSKHKIHDDQALKPNSIIPDINDPNNYCRSCQRTFSSSCAYREHLLRLHDIKPPVSHRTQKVNVTPDIQDPNFYYKACNYTYRNKNTYHKHLRRIHKLKFKIARSRDGRTKN